MDGEAGSQELLDRPDALGDEQALTLAGSTTLEIAR